MMEAQVTLWHKSLKFEHTNNVHWYHGGCNQTAIWRRNYPRAQETKSRHIVNMVTYIIYINEKKQNNKPEKK